MTWFWQVALEAPAHCPSPSFSTLLLQSSLFRHKSTESSPNLDHQWGLRNHFQSLKHGVKGPSLSLHFISNASLRHPLYSPAPPAGSSLPRASPLVRLHPLIPRGGRPFPTCSGGSIHGSLPLAPAGLGQGPFPVFPQHSSFITLITHLVPF